MGFLAGDEVTIKHTDERGIVLIDKTETLNFMHSFLGKRQVVKKTFLVQISRNKIKWFDEQALGMALPKEGVKDEEAIDKMLIDVHLKYRQFKFLEGNSEGGKVDQNCEGVKSMREGIGWI
ncbi:hypothetical protein [Thalassobacillus sp. C254]|uniref:hypothetical protein n=1 Tax=Thalassobacillus sp. C254 TaxID=1225341 RepID=UPI0006D299D0|nr:hypothetical protein [Thalassobacillus sp. C254]